MTRSTIDVDVVGVRGVEVAEIARRAGRGSPLYGRRRAFIDVVTVAEVPDDYESRLIDMHEPTRCNGRSRCEADTIWLRLQAKWDLLARGTGAWASPEGAGTAAKRVAGAGG